MKLYTLGTSHGGTEVGRSCSANLLQYGEDFYLFDCEGDVEKIMKDMNLPNGRIKALFISHMHGDHIGNMHSVAKCFVCGYSKKLVFTHLAPRNIPIIQSVKEHFPFEIAIAYDGMETDF